MDKTIFDIGCGITMTPSSQEDLNTICADLRDGDQAEFDVFAEKERVDRLERVWTVRDGDEILAFVGYKPPKDEDLYSDKRMMSGLTTNAVWRRKKKFVRLSRAVVDTAISTMPPFVNQVFTVPMAEYSGAVKWLERIVGFCTVAHVDLNGVEHLIMFKRR